MRIRTIAVLLFLLCAVGARAEFEQKTWTINDERRRALVWFPESTNSIPPLVFVFHGHGGGAKSAARSFKIHEIWPDAVVVYMQGLPTPGKLTDPEGKKNGWNSDPSDAENRDLNFFDAVYASFSDQVDTNRVYCTGHSNGGGFTYCLWSARRNHFAAVAPSGAVAHRAARKLEPLPALHVAGKNDALVKYAWQNRMMQMVRKTNGCVNAGEPWRSKGELVGTMYASPANTPFVSLIYPGSHTYPQDASELMVHFFKEHRRNPEALK